VWVDWKSPELIIAANTALLTLSMAFWMNQAENITSTPKKIHNWIDRISRCHGY
jgi:hypothetical protein